MRKRKKEKKRGRERKRGIFNFISTFALRSRRNTTKQGIFFVRLFFAIEESVKMLKRVQWNFILVNKSKNEMIRGDFLKKAQKKRRGEKNRNLS